MSAALALLTYVNCVCAALEQLETLAARLMSTKQELDAWLYEQGALDGAPDSLLGAHPIAQHALLLYSLSDCLLGSLSDSLLPAGLTF
jgi:hypothetical protein